MKQYSIVIDDLGVVTGAGSHRARARGRQKHRGTAKDAEGSSLRHVEYCIGPSRLQSELEIDRKKTIHTI